MSREFAGKVLSFIAGAFLVGSWWVGISLFSVTDGGIIAFPVIVSLVAVIFVLISLLMAIGDNN